VSSAAMSWTVFNTSTALKVKSPRLPMGVETIYNLPEGIIDSAGLKKVPPIIQI
jgi:hypothetical protein